jgi:hypothetical protein
MNRSGRQISCFIGSPVRILQSGNVESMARVIVLTSDGYAPHLIAAVDASSE